MHVNMLFKVSQPKQGVTYRVLTWLVTFSQLELQRLEVIMSNLVTHVAGYKIPMGNFVVQVH